MINNATVWINQPDALTPGVPSTASSGFLRPGFGAQISFDLNRSATNLFGTVTQFANSAPGPWTVVGTTISSDALDATLLSGGPFGTGTIFEFTGTITNNTAAPQQLSITHDDGIRVTLDAFPQFSDTAAAPPHNDSLCGRKGTSRSAT